MIPNLYRVRYFLFILCCDNDFSLWLRNLTKMHISELAGLQKRYKNIFSESYLSLKLQNHFQEGLGSHKIPKSENGQNTPLELTFAHISIPYPAQKWKVSTEHATYVNHPIC